MPTDRVHCPSEQVKVWSVWGTGWLLRLASIIADALQEYFCVIAAACGLVCRGRATGAAPVMWRCTRYVALHPNRRGVMPTDRVQRPQSQEQTRNLRGDRRRIRTLTRYCERGQPHPRAD